MCEQDAADNVVVLPEPPELPADNVKFLAVEEPGDDSVFVSQVCTHQRLKYPRKTF